MKFVENKVLSTNVTIDENIKVDEKEGRRNKKNGSRYVTLSQLVDMFYVSRFNRDNLHGLDEGEDIDNSRKHRIYNKSDVKELMEIFFEFFEWAVNEKNIGKIYMTKNISFIRNSIMPRLKYATKMDEICLYGGGCKAGEYYITNGRYTWQMYVEGDMYQKMKELWEKDPEFVQKKKELIPELEEKNKNAKSNKPK